MRTSSSICGAASPTQPGWARIVSSRSAATRAIISASSSGGPRATLFSEGCGIAKDVADVQHDVLLQRADGHLDALLGADVARAARSSSASTPGGIETSIIIA